MPNNVKIFRFETIDNYGINCTVRKLSGARFYMTLGTTVADIYNAHIDDFFIEELRGLCLDKNRSALIKKFSSCMFELKAVPLIPSIVGGITTFNVGLKLFKIDNNDFDFTYDEFSILKNKREFLKLIAFLDKDN